MRIKHVALVLLCLMTGTAGLRLRLSVDLVMKAPFHE